MKTEDLAYIAGLVDGEGHIRIRRFKRQSSGSGHIAVCIFNSDKRMIDFVSERFAGRTYFRQRHADKNHKPSYGWEANGGNAKVFLEAVAPYLLTKKRQAELALKFRAVQEGTPRRQKLRMAGRPTMDAVTTSTRIYLMDEIDKLNKRGLISFTN